MLNPDTPPRRSPPPALVSLAAACLLAVPWLTGCSESPEAPQPPPAGGATSPPPTAATAPALPTPALAESPADQSWAKFAQLFNSPPQSPEAWNTSAPDEAAVREFQRLRGEAAEKVADAAREFYVQHTNDARASRARWHELQLLDAAVKLGNTNALSRLESLEKVRLADPDATEDERFAIRMAAAQRVAERLLAEDEQAAKAALAKSARELIEQFPQRPEPYQILLNLASEGGPEQARAVATSFLTNTVPESIRATAQGVLDKLDRVGKPLELEFTTVDGREIKLADLRGKVVLVDFWATWCQPCIVALPKVKTAYERFQAKGFEILGISFDQDKDSLVKFIEREKMTWPQYFDGKGWDNALGRRFGIDGIPSMWLVDKQGVLRDIDAGEDLEAKIANLLGDTPAAVQ